MNVPFSAYNNWGHYDELGDRVELTEALVESELDALAAWRSSAGLRFDVFQIDCLWFDPAAGYRHFRRPHWPDGPDRVLRRIRDLGMTPGLWFSTNGARLNVPAWEASRAGDRWHYSLADGPYAAALEDGMTHAAEAWGVRFFKLDFAQFDAPAHGSGRNAADNRRASVSRLREILRRLRSRYPDVHVVTHCGFPARNDSELLGSPRPYGADPAWMETVDRMFSGDPHPGDRPQTNLARSIDVFQDRQVWKTHRDGFPLDRIDDHGAVMGRTNTAQCRGRAGFLRTWVAQLARGGRRAFLYGDPTVLTDDDARFMEASRGLFFDAWTRGATARFVSDGEPGLAPWHGVLTGDAVAGLLYVVNPHPRRVAVRCPLPGPLSARVLFHDGRAPAPEAGRDALAVDLAPEQCVLVGLGRYADERWALPPETDDPPPAEMRTLDVETSEAGGVVAAELKSPLRPGERLFATAEALSPPIERSEPPLPFRFARQSLRASDDRSPHAHREVEITLEHGGRAAPPARQIPDVPVWSGISWVARLYDPPPAAFAIRARSRVEPPRRVRLRAFAIREAAGRAAPTARENAP